MSEERILTLQQADQARTDFALIESISNSSPASSPGCRRGVTWPSRARDHHLDGGARHPVGRNVLAPVMGAAAVPGAEHYRELAGKLREVARFCQFVNTRREIIHLAARLESRADHLDRRAGSTTAMRLC
jgi:hypothetical protein